MLSGPLETTLRTFSSVTSHQKPPPTTHSVSNPFYDSCTATRLHMGFARATCAELSLARSHLAELPSGPSGGEGNQMTRTLSAMTTVNRIFDSQAPNLNFFFCENRFPRQQVHPHHAMPALYAGDSLEYNLSTCIPERRAPCPACIVNLRPSVTNLHAGPS